MRSLMLCVLLGVGSVAGCSSVRTPDVGREQFDVPTSEASRVVERQVGAYNRRDLEGFIALFAPNARLYAFPDKLMFEGHEALRAVYGKLFSEAVGLNARVTSRLVQGRFVIDQEITSGMPGKPAVAGVAIYEVTDGRVSRVWFLD